MRTKVLETWNTDTQSLLDLIELPENVVQLEWSPHCEETIVALGVTCHPYKIDLKRLKCIEISQEGVSCICWLPKKQNQILFGFQWGSIVLYDLELKKVVTKFDVPNELVNFLDNSMYAEHRIAQIVFS